ncbi:ABC transporter ATP-binding protein [Kitasatospora sp. NPDC059327]|uniref:ABC transporter ATP-binding protein n=1 Tax=Kitasatospora sp. NPDC059327 TaxID=3346803 RepID=UPI0036CBBA39
MAPHPGLTAGPVPGPELVAPRGADVVDATGPAVRLRGLTRAFNGRTVLDGVDLDLAPGEFTALLGHSGSGKSTLLRALGRLDGHGYDGRTRGGAGRGNTPGATGAGTADTPDRVSVVFQDARLLPWARVLDNVVLGLRGPGAEATGRAVLAEVGLSGRERDWPAVLSGGEAQRAALARALVRQPELLLLDEPFGALDALTRLRMHALLRQLCARYRPCVLLVTHDIDEALALADRVLVLTDGRISHDLRPSPAGATIGTANGGANGGVNSPTIGAAGGTADRSVDGRPASSRAELRRELLAALGVEE